MEAASSFETLVPSYQTAKRDTAEDGNIIYSTNKRLSLIKANIPYILESNPHLVFATFLNKKS
jgi:hypothetical protein